MPDRRTETVAEAVRDLVDREGYDLEGVEVTATGSRRSIAVIIDRDGGVSLDALADLTRDISAQLDTDDPFGDSEYTLEVTTPGIDRPLTLPRHWRRALGRRVSVTLAGGEVLVGRVGAPSGADAADPTAIDLVIPDRRKGPRVRTVPLAEIERAVVEVEFAPPPAAELALCGVELPDADASETEVAGSAAAGEGV
ncbi:ribosome maturation factor RimP [Millisia brevis]|uniref:ribosome maturation factor RimP n=1 Tax=Millisia brevis TaxID=264148 RepID=UPI000829E16D|nr:ribosome maturation factor RimP [Millisia brevis]